MVKSLININMIIYYNILFRLLFSLSMILLLLICLIRSTLIEDSDNFTV